MKHDSDAVAGADYRTRLDLGRAELETELAMATEHPDEAAPDELRVHETQLETNGWHLHCETRAERLAHGILSEIDRLRELSELTEADLATEVRGQAPAVPAAPTGATLRAGAD